MKTTVYDEKYEEKDLYWEFRPSNMLYKALEFMQPVGRDLKALEIGCGEGASAVFLARNGFEVTTFDLSPHAVQKTLKFAKRLDLSITAFVADINEFEIDDTYDLIFSSGTIQYLDPIKRSAFMTKLKAATNANGLHVLHTFVAKPFVAAAPDAEPTEHLWQSGDLLNLYSDWKTEYFAEEISPCNSSGIRHEHAHNRLWTRKMERI